MKDWMRSFVDDVLTMVSIQSFTGDTIGILKCQRFVYNLAMKFDFRVSWHGNGQVLVIQPAGAEKVPELGVVCHLDTVPFNANEWKFNPLGEVVDGRIYGRGVLDDKAAVIMALYAFKSLEDKIRPSWQIIVGSTEEASPWSDMKAFLEEKPVLPKFLVTIDGDGIQNGCRGYSDVVLKFSKETDCEMLEDLWVPDGVNNMVPGKAFARVDGMSLEANGRACHSSIPEEGENALMKLVKKLTRFDEVREGFSKFFEFMELLGEENCAESLGLVRGSTLTPTNCSLEEDTIVLTVNCRLEVGTKRAMVYKMFSLIYDRFGCDLDYSEITLPSYVSAYSDEMQMMCDAYEQVIGRSIVPVVARGTGYNAALPNCAIFGPRFDFVDDEPDLCHAVDESRRIEDLEKFLRMLEIFIDKKLSN